LLGHRDSSITRLYKHLSTADRQRMIDRLPPAFDPDALEQQDDTNTTPKDPTQGK